MPRHYLMYIAILNTQVNVSQFTQKSPLSTKHNQEKTSKKKANTSTMSSLKIISFNAQGLKSPNKRQKVLNWAQRKKFDIMAIQESHYLEDD